jgi:hypothetical protein
VCAEGYSKAIGYKCTKCRTVTSAGIYSAIAILFGSLLLVVCYLATELLGLCNSHVSTSNCMPVKIMKKLASLPWDQLRIPIVSFQIVTQYINITGIQQFEILTFVHLILTSFL